MGNCCSTEASDRERDRRVGSVPAGFSRVRRSQDSHSGTQGNELPEIAVHPPPQATQLTAALLNPLRVPAGVEERMMCSSESFLSGGTSIDIMPPPADAQTAVFRQSDDMLTQPSLSSSSIFFGRNTPQMGHEDTFTEDQAALPAQIF